MINDINVKDNIYIMGMTLTKFSSWNSNVSPGLCRRELKKDLARAGRKIFSGNFNNYQIKVILRSNSLAIIIEYCSNLIGTNFL